MLVHTEIVNIHAAGWHSVRITSTAAGGLIAKCDILLMPRWRIPRQSNELLIRYLQFTDHFKEMFVLETRELHFSLRRPSFRLCISFRKLVDTFCRCQDSKAIAHPNTQLRVGSGAVTTAGA